MQANSDDNLPQPRRLPLDRRPAKPSNWPSIKLVYLPEGKHSQAPDEHCFTWCSQTVSGRIQRKDPECRTTCIRRVFAHEVRNVTGFDRHRRAQRDGTAKYSLPPEGQNNKKDTKPEDALKKRSPRDTKYWEEGWYFWTSKGFWASGGKIDSMRRNLGEQEWREQRVEERRREWEYLQKGRMSDLNSKPQLQSRPTPPPPDQSGMSMLIQMPPPIPPLYQTIKNYLAPTHTLMGVVHESLKDGTQEEFVKKVWATAWTGEPYKLVRQVCSRMWTLWNDNGKDGEGKAGF